MTLMYNFFVFCFRFAFQNACFIFYQFKGREKGESPEGQKEKKERKRKKRGKK